MAAIRTASTQAAAAAARIQAVLQGPDHDPVPCHNDLLPANFLLTDGRVRIVDWEYAGMGDRFFDLGNLAVNNELDDRTTSERLIAAYFGATLAAPPRRAAAHARDERLPRGACGARCRTSSASWTSTIAPTATSTSSGCSRAIDDPAFERSLADAATA